MGQVAGLDKAHEHVAYIRSVLGFIKQGVFSVNNGFFQCTFTDIMPTAGLCRIARFLWDYSCLEVAADAA